MSADKKWRLICYDVRDPKRYRKLYKVMRGIGRRVQYSVFRARLDDREVEQVRWELAKILDPVDRLLVVDLCPTCASRVISRNHVDGWTEQPPPCTIIVRQASAAVAPLLEISGLASMESIAENRRNGQRGW
jgi:CRISPR-associated protein Cas2